MPDKADQHRWVIASTVEVTARQARLAVVRGSVNFTEARIEAQEVYCAECRRPWSDVVDEPCIAANTSGTPGYLRGGPIGERKKRKQYPHLHDCNVYSCEHDCHTLGCQVPRTTGGDTQPIGLVG